MKSYLKWVGSKSAMWTQLEPHFPRHIHGTYYDPFLGSGAVLFALKARQPNLHAVCSDANADLINCHIQVRDHVQHLCSILDELQAWYDAAANDENRRNLYTAVRELFNARTLPPDMMAAYFIFLIKIGYNGLWRVNQKAGLYNVPYGRYSKVKLYDTATITACSGALQGVELQTRSFSEALHAYTCTAADLIYIDPPYVGTGHRAYTQVPFKQSDDINLQYQCQQLHRVTGVPIIASNSISAQLLYADWTIHTVARSGCVSSKATGRQPVGEIVAVLA